MQCQKIKLGKKSCAFCRFWILVCTRIKCMIITLSAKIGNYMFATTFIDNGFIFDLIFNYKNFILNFKYFWIFYYFLILQLLSSTMVYFSIQHSLQEMVVKYVGRNVKFNNFNFLEYIYKLIWKSWHLHDSLSSLTIFTTRFTKIV